MGNEAKYEERQESVESFSAGVMNEQGTNEPGMGERAAAEQNANERGANERGASGRTPNERPNEHRAGEGKLVICPTPIGNLGDVTDRMRACLENAQVVCAEDTRVTGKLLAALGIKRPLERLDEAMLSSRANSVVARVLAGEVIAYCSDAGMPGISDPGLRLVRAAREAGATVEVLPGPVAAATAYVASGCTNQRFFFAGFFPRKDAERRTELQSVAKLDAALIYYESPKRLVDALGVIAQEFPHRQMAVCRELTKLHEEVVRGATSYVHEVFAERAAAEGIKGEIVLVIDGPSEEESAAAAQQTAVDGAARGAQLRAEGASKKDIVKALISELGISRNEAYALALGER